ncbi:MAG TPA: ACP phosphodiesterase [Rudaea sp.]
MNHLAHAWLAGPDPDAQLGGLLADFWRGAPDSAWRERVRAGVVLHRKIDVYTDGHAQVAAARAQFAAPFRRFAGILLDVYFDHALARNWAEYADEPLAAISQRALALLRANASWLPSDLNRFADYFESAGLFARYAERTTIERVLAGIGRRLRHGNPLDAAGPILWERADELDETFARFVPDLRAFAAAQRAALGLT